MAFFGIGKKEKKFDVSDEALNTKFTIECKKGCSLTVDPNSRIATTVKSPEGKVLHEEEWSKWATSPVLCMNHLFDSGISDEDAAIFTVNDTVVELASGLKMYSCSGDKKGGAPGSCLRIEDKNGKELLRAHAEEWAEDPKRFWAYVYVSLKPYLS